MIFFESWRELIRTASSTVLIYFFVIFVVRFFGKRSTSKMNNFDWIVTVAIGAIVGTGILQKKVPVIEVFISVTLLLGLQYIITKASAFWRPVSKLVRARPCLLFFDGVFYEDRMLAERVTRDEIESAVRRAGYADFSAVRAVVLEASATISVIGQSDTPPELLQSVEGMPPSSNKK